VREAEATIRIGNCSTRYITDGNEGTGQYRAADHERTDNTQTADNKRTEEPRSANDESWKWSPHPFYFLARLPFMESNGSSNDFAGSRFVGEGGEAEQRTQIEWMSAVKSL